VAIVGEAELSPYDQLIYQRAKKLINYMTQPFFTTEKQTGKKGEQVERMDTVHDVAAIMSGKCDSVPPEKFMYIGSIASAKLLGPVASVNTTSDAKPPSTGTTPPPEAKKEAARSSSCSCGIS
jgi:hypothetical protein